MCVLETVGAPTVSRVFPWTAGRPEWVRRSEPTARDTGGDGRDPGRDRVTLEALWAPGPPETPTTEERATT